MLRANMYVCVRMNVCSSRMLFQQLSIGRMYVSSHPNLTPEALSGQVASPDDSPYHGMGFLKTANTTPSTRQATFTPASGMYVCMHVFMYLCMYVHIYITSLFVCMCMYVC